MAKKDEISRNIQILKEHQGQPLVRTKAAEELGKLGDRVAVDPLMEVLKEDQGTGDLRSAATQALGRLGDSRSIKALIEYGYDTKSVITALQRMDGKIVTDELVRFLGSEKDSARQRSIELLNGLLKWQELQRAAIVNALIPSLSSEKNELVRNGSVYLLSEFGDRRAVERILGTVVWRNFDPGL